MDNADISINNADSYVINPLFHIVVYSLQNNGQIDNRLHFRFFAVKFGSKDGFVYNQDLL